MFISPFSINFVYMRNSSNPSITRLADGNAAMNYSVDSLYWQDMADKLKGTKYEQLFKMNPFRNYVYKEGWLDKLGDTLGFRTAADRYREQMTLQSNNYDSQLANLMFTNDYNSDLSKVGRMQQAGLNADLLGTSGVTPTEGMPETEVPSIENPVANPSEFCANIMSCVNFAFGLANNIAQFNKLKNDVDAGDIENVKSIFGLVRDYKKFSFDLGDESGLNDLVKGNYFRGSFGSRRNRKTVRFIESAIHGSTGLATDRWKQIKDESESGKEALESIGSKYSPLNPNSESGTTNQPWSLNAIRSSNTFVTISDELTKFTDRIKHLSSKVTSMKLGNQEEFENNINPALKASAENGENLFKYDYYGEMNEEATRGGVFKARADKQGYISQWYENQVRNEIDKTYRSLIHSIARDADNGSTFAQALLLSFTLARMSNFTPVDALKGIGNMF